MKNYFLLTILGVLSAANCFPQHEENRWKIDTSGGITWQVVKNDSHKDHIEMSGKFISAVIRYGLNEDQSVYVSRDIVWPMLRTLPNNTHASLTRTFNFNLLKSLSINRKAIEKEIVTDFSLDGTLVIESTLNGNFQLTRTLFPSVDKPAFCEKYVLKNNSNKTAVIEIPEVNTIVRTNPSEGVEGTYTLKTSTKTMDSSV
jgi:hypothetical protein